MRPVPGISLHCASVVLLLELEHKHKLWTGSFRIPFEGVGNPESHQFVVVCAIQKVSAKVKEGWLPHVRARVIVFALLVWH